MQPLVKGITVIVTAVLLAGCVGHAAETSRTPASSGPITAPEIRAEAHHQALDTYAIVRGTAVAEQMGPSVYALTNGWLAMAGTIARAAAPVGIVALWEAWSNPDAVLWATLALFLLAFAGIPVMRQRRTLSEST